MVDFEAQKPSKEKKNVYLSLCFLASFSTTDCKIGELAFDQALTWSFHHNLPLSCARLWESKMQVLWITSPAWMVRFWDLRVCKWEWVKILGEHKSSWNRCLRVRPTAKWLSNGRLRNGPVFLRSRGWKASCPGFFSGEKCWVLNCRGWGQYR